MLILVAPTVSITFKAWCKNKCALREAEGVVRCLSPVWQYGNSGRSEVLGDSV